MRLYIWRGFLKNWKANNKNGADIRFYAPSFNVNIPPYLASPVMFSSLLDLIMAPGERGSALIYSVAPIFGSSLASWPLFLPFLSTSSSSFLYPMAFPRLQASSSIIRSLFPHLNSTQSVDSISTMGIFTTCKMGKDIVNFPITTVCIGDLTIRGAIRYTAGCYPAAVDLVASGMINSKVMVTHRFPFRKQKRHLRLLRKAVREFWRSWLRACKENDCNTSSSLERREYLERNGHMCWFESEKCVQPKVSRD